MSSNQSLQDLAGVKHRRLRLAAVPPGGKSALGHLQRKQPLSGPLRGESGAVVSGCACEIIHRRNDVAGDLWIGLRISREQAIEGRNAAVGALRIENPAQ